jgi:pyruvyltransferase
VATEPPAITRVDGVDVVHWNPRRNTLPFPFRRLPVGRRVGNFGDLLGPVIVQALRDRADSPAAAPSAPTSRLLSVGSIVHLASDGDLVWGSGVNAKNAADEYRFRTIDVRAVRGPLTRAWLADRGVDAPAVYGDPALLLPMLFPDLRARSACKTRRLTVVPNLHDAQRHGDHPDVVDPRAPWRAVVDRIAQSEAVVGSSLHGIVIAESLGIPCALVRPGDEPDFKYRDFYAGAGREIDEPFAETIEEAVARTDSWEPLDAWRAQSLIDAFPVELWRQSLADRPPVSAG